MRKNSAMSQPQPTPYPYYSPPPPPPHSHDRYVGAIIVVGIVALISGVVVGYGTGLGNGRTEATSSQPQQSSFTFSHGNVGIGTTPGDTPVSIFLTTRIRELWRHQFFVITPTSSILF